MPFSSKLLLFTILLSLTVTTLWAQKVGQARLDSLLRELPNARQDTNSVKLMRNISNTYAQSNPIKAIQFATNEINLAQQLNWPKGVSRGYADLTIAYMANSDYPSALENAFIALEKYRERKDLGGEESVLENIGIIYTMQRNQKMALHYELQSLYIATRLSVHEPMYKKAVANILGNIGNAYYVSHNYPKALEYELQALDMSVALNNKNYIANNLGNIGNVYNEQKKYNVAIPYYFNALRMYKELGDQFGVARNQGNIGELLVNVATVDTIHTIAPDSLIPGGKQQRLTLGIQYLKSGIATGQKINYQDAVISFTLSLAAAYKAIGDYKNALESEEQYHKLKDSIFSNENTQKIKELESKEILDIKDRDLQLARLAIAKKRTERGFYLAGIAVLILIICIVLKNNRSQKHANHLLEEAKLKTDGLMHNLEASLQQKEVLMKEIHHRVKNNLQVIGNLLELQGSATSDEAAKAAMAEGQGRVKSIALIHQKLYQNDNIATIEFREFIRDLYNQVATIFLQPRQGVAASFQVPETMLDIDTAIPLGLIINELLTNAFKYAYTPAKNGELTIVLTHIAEAYRLVVTDNGPGLPAGQDLKSFTSLGLKLIFRLSKQLGGYTEYSYNNGSVFTIHFKDLDARKKTL